MILPAVESVQDVATQAGKGAVTFGYYAQYVIAPALFGFAAWARPKLNQFFDDFHALAQGIRELGDQTHEVKKT